MALTRLRFERFTAFEQLDVGLSPGINVPVLHRGQVFIFGVLKSRKGNSFRFMSRHAALQSCCAETDRRALLAQYKKRNVADKLLTLRKQGSCFLMLETDHRALVAQQPSE